MKEHWERHIDKLNAEIVRLRKLIKGAHHDEYCETIKLIRYTGDGDDKRDECDCFKSKVKKDI